MGMSNDDKIIKIRQIRESLEEFESDMEYIIRKEKEAEEHDRRHLQMINESLDDEHMDRKLVAIYSELQELHLSINKIREELLECIRKEIKERNAQAEDEINSIDKHVENYAVVSRKYTVNTVNNVKKVK